MERVELDEISLLDSTTSSQYQELEQLLDASVSKLRFCSGNRDFFVFGKHLFVVWVNMLMQLPYAIEKSEYRMIT